MAVMAVRVLGGGATGAAVGMSGTVNEKVGEEGEEKYG
jgi:hypothetical protein